jgi:glutathione-specific gamma-glutamylcyclotransferase
MTDSWTVDPAELCPALPKGDLWVFAYGSLIWNPGFPYEEARPGLLRGYHRAFCLRSTRYRGTPDCPGLVLGLDRGGACRGIAYRVVAAQARRAMDYLWEREMINLSYHCRDLAVRVAGRPVRARTFVVRRDTGRYFTDLSVGDTARIIAAACGERGTNREYLENTVRHLDQLGIPDRRLHDMLKAVRRIDGSTPVMRPPESLDEDGGMQ